jgi:hypothetical protein
MDSSCRSRGSASFVKFKILKKKKKAKTVCVFFFFFLSLIFRFSLLLFISPTPHEIALEMSYMLYISPPSKQINKITTKKLIKLPTKSNEQYIS